jgi:DNA polymerase-3 subunit epsilon
MRLCDLPILFLDCQTTGMRPTSGSLLECAWSTRGDRLTSHLVVLPEGEFIPAPVQDLTGINLEMLNEAISEEELLEKLIAWASAHPEAPVLAHYAQFERPFLEDLFHRHGKEMPFSLLCTYRVARKLYPASPSRNIRGLVGYLGFSFREIKRAQHHVQATMEIWDALEKKLAELGVETLPALIAWLEEKPKKEKKPAPVRYEYHVDRLKRLELPNVPGVYRMLSKAGDILYVGKATSLKDRVNSYFRGKKGREKRKLELMAQVWDFQITECGSPLEAALLESDEIKKFDPPYNVSLKAGRRELHFYTRDFSNRSAEQSAEYPLGPFRGFNATEQLRRLEAAVATNNFSGVFYEITEPALFAQGYEIFAARRFGGGAHPPMRKLLAMGLRLLRDATAAEEGEIEEELLEDNLEHEAQLEEESPEEVADRLDRMLLVAAANYRKSKALTKLLHARVEWAHQEKPRLLEVRGGSIFEDKRVAGAYPWARLGLSEYDRMSILFSEVNRGDYRVTYQVP